MEHRLCYQRGEPRLGNAANEAASAAVEREQIERTMREHMTHLNEEQQEQLIQDALTSLPRDPAKAVEWMNMRLTNLKQRSTALSEMFATELVGAKQDIDASLIGKERTDMDVIISALQRPLPHKNGIKHRYGNSDDGIDFARIETDQRYIRSLINAFPQAQDALHRIDTALTQLTQQDIRYEVRQIERSNEKHKVDQVLGGLGKMTGAVVMVAGVLLTGIPAIMHSWKSKKVDPRHFLPSLLYAGIATVIVSPSLRRQIFSSAEQNTLTDIDATLNNPLFRAHCEDYGLQGPAAANVIKKMMEQPANTKAMVAKLRAKGQSTEGLEKDIQTYIRQMTTDAHMQEALQRMFDEHRFSDLPHMLSFATTTDAKGVILDYIRIGARPYGQQVQQIEGQIDVPDVR